MPEMKLLKDILDKYKFTEKENDRIMSVIQNFIKKLDKTLKDNAVIAEPALGGSSAKGTIVRGDFDCDIFVRFDYSYKDKTISDILENAIGRFKNVDRMHGSRDYFQLVEDDIKFEIVPVLKIDNPNKAQNVTDMSPLHVAWIRYRLDKNPKLIDEIILAKIFCKAQGLYGAESYISGFSGHVLDILVVYYGSFMKLLENACTWQKYKVIDIEGYNTSDELNQSKISPLIVIDPVDKNRNAAAALSIDKFTRFKRKAGEFITSPSEDFFKKNPMTIDSLNNIAGKNKLIAVSVKPKKGKVDVMGSRLLKLFTHMSNQLSANEFSIIDSGWEWDKKHEALLWYIIDQQRLPENRLHVGPPLNEEHDAKAFKKKHKDCFIRGNRLHVMVKREFREPEILIKSLLEGKYVRQRAEQTKIYIKTP